MPVYTRTIILGGKGFPRSRDIDNVHKICQDMAVKAGILKNDSVTNVQVSAQMYVNEWRSSVFEGQHLPIPRYRGIEDAICLFEVGPILDMMHRYHVIQSLSGHIEFMGI